MGRLIQYSGSLFVLGVLVVLIYRILVELGIVPANFLKEKRPALFVDLSVTALVIEISVFLVAFIIYNAVYGKTNFFDWETIWLSGDTRQMVDLAANGFSAGSAPNGTLPFYPLLLRFLGGILGNAYYLAGLIVSTLATITACYFFYRLVTLDYDERVAKNSLTFLLCFPFIFYMFLPLSDSLFLAFTIAAFYSMRRQKWFTVAVLSLLAVLCDLRGVLLILPIIYEFGRQRKNNWDVILPSVFIITGVSAILAFCQLQFGNPFALFNHYSSSFNFVNSAWNADNKVLLSNILPLLALLAILIIICFFALGRIRVSYLLYAVPLGAIAFFVPWLDNRPHFFIMVFPLFIELGLLAKNKTANLLLLFLSTVFLGFYLFCYLFFKLSL